MILTADAIGKNIDAVRERMRTAATRAGRNVDTIRLVAVSKRMPNSSVEAAISAGQYCFGENTAQGAAARRDLTGTHDTEWHFIGHLQTNKAKVVGRGFDWLHTLDSLKLANKISAVRADTGTPINVLLQVNIAGDPDKYGLTPNAVLPMADALLTGDYPGIDLRGLMTIGQRGISDDQRRMEFIALRELADSCASRLGARHFSELSMGMSEDFELAIAEGATMVRIGSTIFGSRPAAS